MKMVVLILVMLGNDGHWLAGQKYDIAVTWNVDARESRDDVVLRWELRTESRTLAQGDTPLKNDGGAKVTIEAPGVRTRTELRWAYRVLTKDNELLTQGTERLFVYPVDQIAEVRPRIKNTRIVVADAAAGPSSLLTGAGIEHEHVDDIAKLGMIAANLLIVGPDQLADSLVTQSALIARVEAGATVVILRQSKARSLAGYPLVNRPAPTRLECRLDHEVLRGLDDAALRGFARGGASRPEGLAIRLPADEPVLELAWWPRESPGRDPVPIDALLAVKAIGKGRLVLCQFPLGPWDSDPRSQLMLRNLIDYSLSPSCPTPAPSLRSADAVAPIVRERNILTPPGAQP